jgi:hypothetical protein
MRFCALPSAWQPRVATPPGLPCLQHRVPCAASRRGPKQSGFTSPNRASQCTLPFAHSRCDHRPALCCPHPPPIRPAARPAASGGARPIWRPAPRRRSLSAIGLSVEPGGGVELPTSLAAPQPLCARMPLHLHDPPRCTPRRPHCWEPWPARARAPAAFVAPAVAVAAPPRAPRRLPWPHLGRRLPVACPCTHSLHARALGRCSALVFSPGAIDLQLPACPDGTCCPACLAACQKQALNAQGAPNPSHVCKPNFSGPVSLIPPTPVGQISSTPPGISIPGQPANPPPPGPPPNSHRFDAARLQSGAREDGGGGGAFGGPGA